MPKNEKKDRLFTTQQESANFYISDQGPLRQPIAQRELVDFYLKEQAPLQYLTLIFVYLQNAKEQIGENEGLDSTLKIVSNLLIQYVHFMSKSIKEMDAKKILDQDPTDFLDISEHLLTVIENDSEEFDENYILLTLYYLGTIYNEMDFSTELYTMKAIETKLGKNSLTKAEKKELELLFTAISNLKNKIEMGRFLSTV